MVMQMKLPFLFFFVDFVSLLAFILMPLPQESRMQKEARNEAMDLTNLWGFIPRMSFLASDTYTLHYAVKMSAILVLGEYYSRVPKGGSLLGICCFSFFVHNHNWSWSVTYASFPSCMGIVIAFFQRQRQILIVNRYLDIYHITIWGNNEGCLMSAPQSIVWDACC